MRLLLVWLLILICSCERGETPRFTAAGFWKENTALGAIGLLNRPDGTSRLYILDNKDTAEARHKYDGRYSVHGDKFTFQTDSNPEGIEICLETTHTESGIMAGMLVTKSFSQLAEFTSF
jgi:hypothetical protein